jgi:hypothetical protein
VDDEAVDLQEGAGVEQELETLARGLLPRLVLSSNSLFAAAELGLAVATAELLQTLVHRHGVTVDGVVTKVNGFIDFHADLP